MIEHVSDSLTKCVWHRCGLRVLMGVDHVGVDIVDVSESRRYKRVYWRHCLSIEIQCRCGICCVVYVDHNDE